MRLKLIFGSKETEKDYYVRIYKNKIIEYEGLYPIVLGYVGIGSKKQIEGKVKFNIEYVLIPLDKYDSEGLGIKATHQLGCRELYINLGAATYVNLNLLQKIYVWFYKYRTKEDLDFKLKKWQIYIFWPAFIIAALGGVYGLYDSLVTTPSIYKDLQELQSSKEQTESELSILRTLILNQKKVDSLNIPKTQKYP